jgi:hypothetical protein
VACGLWALEAFLIFLLKSCDSNDLSTSVTKKILQLSKAAEEAVGMALQVLIAHTGQRFQTDPGSFAS